MAAAVKKGLEVAVTPEAAQKLVCAAALPALQSGPFGLFSMERCNLVFAVSSAARAGAQVWPPITDCRVGTVARADKVSDKFSASGWDPFLAPQGVLMACRGG